MCEPTPPDASDRGRSGFALVISLSLMAFVLLLLLTITTLVQVETEASVNGLKRFKADQNALLALQEAIGTLQKEMGPDQRISANADILNAAGNDNSVGVENSYLVGVWDSSGDRTNTSVEDRSDDLWRIGDPINYASRARNGFRRWLISTPGNSLDPESLATAGNDYRNSLPAEDVVRLLGEGTLQPDPVNSGGASPSLEEKEIWAPLVDVNPSSGEARQGRFGWAVLDEGVKARLNLDLRDAPGSVSEALTYWDSPGAMGVEAMGESNEFAGFPKDTSSPGRVLNFEQSGFLFGGTPSQNDLGSYYHDVSFYSKSVLSNVVDGGLKRDLSSLAGLNSNPPSGQSSTRWPVEYRNRRLYSDSDTGSAINSEADPHWSALLDYINLYTDSNRLQSSSGGLPRAQSTLTEWKGDPSPPGAGDRASVDLPLPAPDTYRLAPAITKLEIYLSLVALPPHDTYLPSLYKRGLGHSTSFYVHLTDNFSDVNNETNNDNEDLNYVRQVYLIATPVVTFQNPYNVPLDLSQMWMVMRDPPIGLKFYLYNHEGIPGVDPDVAVPMTRDFVALAEMAERSWAIEQGGDYNQLRFGMKLSNLQLDPGETIVYSPRFEEGTLITETLWNSAAEKQHDLTLSPGYDAGVGVMWDQPTPQSAGWTTDKISVEGHVYEPRDPDNPYRSQVRQINTHQGTYAMLMINGDRLRVEVDLVDGTQNTALFDATSPSTDPSFPDTYDGTFSLELYGSDPNLRGNQQEDTDTADLIGRYVFDYNEGTISNAKKNTSESDREALLAKSASANLNETYSSGIIAVDKIGHTTGTPLDTGYDGGTAKVGAKAEDLIPYTFAVFRVGGKVTQEENGIAYHPAVPHLQTNLSQLAGHYDIGEESPAFQPYDLSIEVPPGSSGTVGPNLGLNNEGYHFTGQTETTGKSLATQYEIPISPLQSIASLQHADIFGGGYLPKVRYAAGNSFAHPLLPANAASLASTAVGYGFFDHSYLSNHGLWDRYYFSTIADQQSVFDSSAPTVDAVFDDWMSGGDAPNAAMKPYFHGNTSAGDARTELINGTSPQPEAYRKMASYQTLDGGFNVNSTSVEAWKAILATSNLVGNPQRIPTYTDSAFALTDETGTGSIQAAFSRFRIPNFDNPLEASTNEDRSLWQGYRELNEAQVDALAAAIVDQVRYRGPFLSMAEFVNRRLSTDDRSDMGVIDAAIEAVGLNDLLDNNAGRELDGGDESYLNSNDYGMIQNPQELSDDSYTARGIPAFLTQADIMQSIGSQLSARSDTFVIRGYGDVRDISGDIVARSICEAVVQRVPDYVDGSQMPYHDDIVATVGPDGLSPSNATWGRKFKIVDLRWLEDSEI